MTPKFILASNSPRRRDLLSMLGMDFKVTVSECDETIPAGMSPRDAVKMLAERKAGAVHAAVGDLGSETFIIAADTVVCDGNRILGKPADADDALRALLSLSGRSHSVLTGIAVIGRYGEDIRVCTDAVETTVTFGAFTEEDARCYVETGEPLDKAGSYGIQGMGGLFVTEMHGDYYNVVGLPIARLRSVLEESFGLRACDYLNKR